VILITSEEDIMATAAKVDATEEQARALVEESRETSWAKPSFAKEMFLGRFRLDLIHPYPQPDPTAP
jgi:hypothetical protein